MNRYFNNEFFKNLEKPWFQPPDFLFTPVWIILYIFMATSLVLIMRAPHSDMKPLAFTIFGLQLFMNLLWSPVFFGLNKIRTAFFICIALIILVAAMIFVFYKISKPAALINIPYILWLLFAAILNFYIWRNNLPVSNQ